MKRGCCYKKENLLSYNCECTFGCIDCAVHFICKVCGAKFREIPSKAKDLKWEKQKSEYTLLETKSENYRNSFIAGILKMDDNAVLPELKSLTRKELEAIALQLRRNVMSCLVVLIITFCGCLDNPLGDLPDLIRLPFEGSGMPAQNIRENQAEMTEWRTEGSGKPIILEVEGACDGYATGAAWITCYEDKVAPISTLLGVGYGPDGLASTDSRPCLRYEIRPRFVNEFIEVIVACAEKTGMWRVSFTDAKGLRYFNRQTGLIDGEPEFDCIELWEASK